MRKATLSILVIFFVMVTGATVFAGAQNTTGYERISELKAWNTHIDIYLADNEQHVCSGGLVTRFLLDPAKEQHYDLLLSAFTSGKRVQLSYNCEADGFPWIDGVRVKYQ